MNIIENTQQCVHCKSTFLECFFDVTRTGRRKQYCRSCCDKFSKEAKKRHRKRPNRLYDGYTYESRNRILRELGFLSYQAYLQSDLWKEIRVKVYAQKGRQCYLCENPATELHHNRYHLNDLRGKKIRFINPICRQCHKGIEFKEGEKETVWRANKSFQRLRRAKNRSKRNG